ncbi:MAG: hypothetical protein ABGY95_04220 [Rubritalea sp.]|uniref:hypothetical protein n=1 Tax=Rubritalea sp. TaxID=2109375 RepID=UPI003242E8C1
MKTIFCCCVVVLSPLAHAAETPKINPVTVSIDVPSPAWSLNITSIHKKGNKLLVVCNALQKEGMSAAMLSKATDSVLIPSKFAQLPRDVYVIGQKWNYSDGYKAVTRKEMDTLLMDSTTVYTAKKMLTEKSFIGLSVKEAHALAKENKIPSRVVEIDGEPQPSTMDIRPERFNFAIKKGKVTRVTKG